MSGRVDQLDVMAVRQRFPMGERSGALLAMVAPILSSHLFGISKERLSDVAGGDHTAVRLRQLPYLRRKRSGDRGTAFEYAVHYAIRQCNWSIVEPLWDVLADEFAVDG